MSFNWQRSCWRLGASFGQRGRPNCLPKKISHVPSPYPIPAVLGMDHVVCRKYLPIPADTRARRNELWRTRTSKTKKLSPKERFKKESNKTNNKNNALLKKNPLRKASETSRRQEMVIKQEVYAKTHKQIKSKYKHIQTAASVPSKHGRTSTNSTRTTCTALFFCHGETPLPRRDTLPVCGFAVANPSVGLTLILDAEQPIIPHPPPPCFLTKRLKINPFPHPSSLLPFPPTLHPHMRW